MQCFPPVFVQHAEAEGSSTGVTDSGADEGANAQFQSTGALALEVAPKMPEEFFTFNRSGSCLVGAPALQQPSGTGGFLIFMPVYPVLLTMLLPVF